MYKRFLHMVFVLGLVFCLSPVAQAAQTGVIRIMPRHTGESISGGTVSIMHVGRKTEDGYLIQGKTGNWLIAADEVFFPETATWVKKHAKGTEITQKAASSGGFVFDNLKEGLYLVTQPEAAPGYIPFSPFLIELPVGSEVWEAEAFPKVEELLPENPKTGDHPAPIIAAMGLVFSFFALLVIGDKRRK